MSDQIYGVMAEFEGPSELVSAARAAREKGYRKLDAYTPFPIEELTDALHLHHNKLPLLVLVGGICGGILGYLLQYYVTVVYFPINIAGRPLHSWPSYVVITFEMTILFAALSAVLGLMAALPEIALLAASRGLDFDLVAGAYFAMGRISGIDRLRGKANGIVAAEHWDRLAIRRIVDDLYAGQRALTAAALEPAGEAKGRAAGADAVQIWQESHSDALTRATSFLAALEAAGPLSVAKLTLGNSQIHELAVR